MHLDGARLWHVAVETGMSMKELCEPFDTVSLCFSKGLGTFCEPNVTLFQKYLIDTK